MNSSSKKKEIPHPRANANPLSAVTFYWILGTFKKGFKKDFEVEDLYSPLEEHRSGYLGDKVERLWNQELQQANDGNKDPSVFRVLRKCFGRNVIVLGIILAIGEIVFKVTQPLFIGGLIRHFSPDSNVSRDTAFMYAGAIVVCSTVNVLLRQSYMLAMFHVGMKMRISLCSLLYRKALRLSKTALRETTVGQAVNLLSNDVNRLDTSVVFVVYLWFGPLKTVVILYLMWLEIGYAAIIGVATIILIIPLQAFFGRLLSTLRLRTAKRTDVRIRFMNEIIIGIQVIKMYAWEKPFAHLVSLARKREIRAVKAACFVRGTLLSIGKFSTKIAIFVAIVTYVALGNKITAEKMFVVTGFVNILNKTMTDNFPRSIAYVSEAVVSIKRIQQFLLYDEVCTVARLPMKNAETTVTVTENKQPGSGYKVEITENGVLEGKSSMVDNLNVCDPANNKRIKVINVTAKWVEDMPDNTLSNVSVDVKPGGLVAIIGPVGSGKTSLLHAILKELPLTRGSIYVGGSISYASQEPWLFAGSIRQNILFGQPMEKERYRKVVKACALQRDFQLLPHSDKTIVGERGVTLSGGQRARVNLARAVYKQADIYILDDPLSAVDTHVGRHLFEDCICDLLQSKTRVLVTHQVQYLQKVDRIVILNNGTVEAAGTYSELQESGLNFAKQLDVEIKAEDEKGDHQPLVHSDSQISFRRTKRQSSETSELSSLEEFEPVQLAEMRTRGKIQSSVYRAYCSAGGNCGISMLVLAVFILAQLAISIGDYWMSFWTKVEEQKPSTVDEIATNSTSASVNDTFTPFPDVNITTIAPTNYTEWGWMPSTETCIFVYTGLVSGIVVLTLASTLLFFTLCMRASVNLHNSMFNSITRATMWFFNNNPSGQILNRFSKDMGAIDEILPQTMMDCVQRSLMIMGVITVVAVVNYWILVPTIAMLVVFYLLRIYYVATSRSIKRLEGVTRSPVFSHLNASLQGLTTIRAFGTQAMLEKEFDNHQDLHSTTHYLFIAANRAFGLWLDGICVVYIALVTLSFLMGGEQYGGDVGLALTQATGLTGMLQWGIRQAAEMENQMTSVERVLEYTTVESEPPVESSADKKPPKDWPAKGTIVFNEVSLSYSSDEPPVLKNVSFSIKSAEKVGIVGRTGAGKSSLVTALFRLVDPSAGSIYVDGVHTLPIGLHDLRSKISIIPQEPALFSGVLRENLDPFEEFSDAVLWSALEEVELKHVVDDLPAGLNHVVSEGGTNFSVGQRQLLCLARAIIRNNKILVLDEATANVDPQTDELIQTTIRRKFTDCTVLTIAHRLNTIIDSDRIIVMDAGSVVEFDHPYVLLKNENGYLSQMVWQTGQAMAESLLKAAEISFESMTKRS